MLFMMIVRPECCKRAACFVEMKAGKQVPNATRREHEKNTSSSIALKS